LNGFFDDKVDDEAVFKIVRLSIPLNGFPENLIIFLTSNEMLSIPLNGFKKIKQA